MTDLISVRTLPMQVNKFTVIEGHAMMAVARLVRGPRVTKVYCMAQAKLGINKSWSIVPCKATHFAGTIGCHSAKRLSCTFGWRRPTAHVDWGLHFTKPIFSMNNGCSNAWSVARHVFDATGGSFVNGNIGTARKHN